MWIVHNALGHATSDSGCRRVSKVIFISLVLSEGTRYLSYNAGVALP
jgi:hypothetical protein